MNLARIRRLLAAPTFEDEEENRVAGLANVMCLVLLVAAAGGMVAAAADFYVESAQMLAVGAAGALLALWLLRRRYLASASLLVLLLFLGVLVGLLIVGSGIHDVAMMAFPGVIVVAALLLDRRWYLAYALLTIVCLQGVALGEMTGLITNDFSELTTWADLVYVSLITVVTAVAAYLLAENITRSMTRVRASRRELLESNLELQLEIAERARAQEAYRTLVDHSLQGLIIVQDGRIVFANQAFSAISGYAEEELLALSAEAVTALVHPDDQARVDALYNARQDELSVVDRLQFRGHRKDGSVGWLEAHASLVEYQSRPAIQMALIDITAGKQAEEDRAHLLARIQAQASQLQQVVATVPDGVILLDVGRAASGQILLANPPAIEHLTVLAESDEGDLLTRLGDRTLPQLLTAPSVGWWHEVAADEPSKRRFQVIARPLKDAPDAAGWVLVVRDVTQEREIQERVQEQERLAAVGQLAAGIAHDFNNILATIVLYAQMSARSPELPLLVRERMNTISEQAKRATELIQQILDFSRRARLERRPMDLLGFLQEQIKLLERTLPATIKINLVSEGDQYFVDADPTRIQQVITNLALNARDAMPNGGALGFELRGAQIGPDEQAALPGMEIGEAVVLKAWDTGEGIPRDVLPHIFEPFFTTKPAGQGAGLGLSQVWGIVKQHEGYIRVDTQAGQGTTFVIYLPALQTPQQGPLVGEGIAPAQGRGETILVVEDNPQVQRTLVEALELLNYRPITAANGQEAIAIFEGHGAGLAAGRQPEIALVLTDMVMPEMGGATLLQLLRGQGWTGPAIMLSGHPLSDRTEDLRSVGVVDCLQKPVGLHQLAEALTRALGGTAA
jgi:two-component system cell cycle sensor histidine kinase/response regulator CckA